MTSYDIETDVLVVGAGGCGLAAAIASHDLGAEVVVVEKMERAGGNTALSTGSVPAAGTRFQRAAGIDDSPERMAADLERLAGAHDVPEVTRRLAEVSAALVDWLVDTVGARLRLITEYRHVGHSVPRLHAPDSRRGQDLLDDLWRAVEQRQIPVALASPIKELLRDESGTLVGALAEGPDGATRIRAHKIILACNGFAGNPGLVATYCAEIAGAPYYGALGSTGEAVTWGRKLGAALSNMAAYQGYAAVAYPHGSLLTWTTIEKGGILVNGQGARFGNEGIGYSGYAREVMAQGDPVYAIFDARIRDIAALEEEFRELLEYGGIKQADSVAQIAASTGLPADALDSTIKVYNAAAAGRAADAHGRHEFGIAPLEPPFFICRVKPGLFHTQGGLRTDTDGRVLDSTSRPIANLFAGGGAAAGLSGRSGAAGYASGNGLLSAIGLGWLAGKAAAAEIAASRTKAAEP